jgi:hypothetical protein
MKHKEWNTLQTRAAAATVHKTLVKFKSMDSVVIRDQNDFGGLTTNEKYYDICFLTPVWILMKILILNSVKQMNMCKVT